MKRNYENPESEVIWTSIETGLLTVTGSVPPIIEEDDDE